MGYGDTADGIQPRDSGWFWGGERDAGRGLSKHPTERERQTCPTQQSAGLGTSSPFQNFPFIQKSLISYKSRTFFYRGRTDC